MSTPEQQIQLELATNDEVLPPVDLSIEQAVRHYAIRPDQITSSTKASELFIRTSLEVEHSTDILNQFTHKGLSREDFRVEYIARKVDEATNKSPKEEKAQAAKRAENMASRELGRAWWHQDNPAVLNHLCEQLSDRIVALEETPQSTQDSVWSETEEVRPYIEEARIALIDARISRLPEDAKLFFPDYGQGVTTSPSDIEKWYPLIRMAKYYAELRGSKRGNGTTPTRPNPDQELVQYRKYRPETI